MHPVWILVCAISIVLVGILVFRLHAFIALLLAALVVAVLTPRAELEQYAAEQVEQGEMTAATAAQYVKSPAPVRVADGFGNTCGSIGILIAMAAIIGKCLLDSGAADRIVRGTVGLVGTDRAPVAFVGSGFLLGIPVFFDTVFYLMMPLGKALHMRTGKNYLLYILTIVAGATMAHSLVPPTPGPLYVADKMQVGLLTMICGGTLVGLVASSAGYAAACWMNRRMQVPLRPSVDVSLDDLRQLAARDVRELPPLWLSLAPIVLPVALIAAQTALQTYLKSLPEGTTSAWQDWKVWFDTLGDKNVALMMAAAIALLMLAWQKRANRNELAAAVQSALASGGVIILITAAGGAFGTTIRQCGIADTITQATQNVHPLLILPFAFLVTTLIRTAQGSATVAMITAASVMQQFAETEGLGFHNLYLALAIGCGSKPIAWMADSGFWVICKMSGMTEVEALKTITPLSIVMGVSGLAATMLGAWWIPLR